MDVGELFYNGFRFPPAISATVNQAAIRDSSDRFTKYRRYTLRVEFIVYPGVDKDIAATPYFPTDNGGDPPVEIGTLTATVAEPSVWKRCDVT